MNSIFDHAAWQQYIDEQEWWFSASELHGILSALLAFNQNNAKDALLGGNIGETAFLSELSPHIEQALSGESLSYQLLLPEESNNAQRAEALVQWVQGFLLATGYCEKTAALQLDSDAQGFVNDLRAFANLDTMIDDSEESQTELMALEEHCRMGALLLYANSRIAPRNQKPH